MKNFTTVLIFAIATTLLPIHKSYGFDFLSSLFDTQKSYQPINTNNLDIAIKESKEGLLRYGNQFFNSYFNDILNASKNSQSDNNINKIIEFLDWSEKNELIDKSESIAIKFEYFHYEFYSHRESEFPDLCFHKDDVIRSLKDELLKKEKALFHSLNKPAIFKRAQLNYSDITTVVDGACK